MELANIERLLEKYFEATTTVAEEQTLQQYFSQNNVAPHLEQYQPMFTYFSIAKTEQSTRPVPLKRRFTKYYKWISVAAVAVLAFGAFLNVNSTTSLEDEFTQEEIKSAQMALALFGKSFKKGTEGYSYLAEFEKNTTSKFLNNK